MSDRGGFTDIYRVVIETGETFRVTRAATGVSGVTATSPAISVARENGRLMFSVFDKAGFRIAGVAGGTGAGRAGFGRRARRIAEGSDGSAPDTTPVGSARDTTPAPRATKSAAMLPSDGQGGTSAVIGYLHNADDGLPVGLGDRRAAVSHGVSSRRARAADSRHWNEQRVRHAVLGRHVRVLQRHAWRPEHRCRNPGERPAARHWRAAVVPQHREPLELGCERIAHAVRVRYGALTNTGAQYVYEHVAINNVSAILQYPFSQTRRLELSAGYTHYGYSMQSATQDYFGRTSRLTDLAAPPALGLKSATIALVGDASSFGFTSPISGSRFRFEVTPTLGTLDYNTVLLDYRKYFFMKPFTLAMRGMHYGLYGKDSESNRMGALYLGDGSLVRGYSYNSFTNNDCATSGSGSLASSACPQFDRLVGSRLASRTRSYAFRCSARAALG